ncbi:hypothetical protein RFI_18082, partial [Reticulomyxa filosa]
MRWLGLDERSSESVNALHPNNNNNNNNNAPLPSSVRRNSQVLVLCPQPFNTATNANANASTDIDGNKNTNTDIKMTPSSSKPVTPHEIPSENDHPRKSDITPTPSILNPVASPPPLPRLSLQLQVSSSSSSYYSSSSSYSSYSSSSCFVPYQSVMTYQHQDNSPSTSIKSLFYFLFYVVFCLAGRNNKSFK